MTVIVDKNQPGKVVVVVDTGPQGPPGAAVGAVGTGFLHYTSGTPDGAIPVNPVTSGHMTVGSANTVLTSNGSVGAWTPISSIATTPGGSDGDVQVKNGPDLEGIAPGASGNVLTSTGSAWHSAAPAPTITIGGSAKDLVVKETSTTTSGLSGAAGQIVRRSDDGTTWEAQDGAEIPSGSTDDVVGLDGTGGLKNLGPLPAGGAVIDPGTPGNLAVYDTDGTTLIDGGPVPGGGSGGSAGGAGVLQASDGAGGFTAVSNFVATGSGVAISAAGFWTWGTGTMPTSGLVRLPQAVQSIIRSIVTGGTERDVLAIAATDTIQLGHQTGYNVRIYSEMLELWGNSSFIFYVGGGATEAGVITSSAWKFAFPRLGDGTPYASEGRQSITWSGSTTVTLNATQYSRKILKLTGSTGTGTIVLPAAASEDASYIKKVFLTAGSPDAVFTTGSGTTVNSAGTSARYLELWVTPDGVEQMP